MAAQPLTDMIRSIPIFSALSREDIAKVLGKMEELSFPPDSTIFSQGDQGDSFYLIQSGAVQVVVESGAGKSEVVAILGPRDFGIVALALPPQREADVPDDGQEPGPRALAREAPEVTEGAEERVLQHVLRVGLVTDQGPRQPQGCRRVGPGEPFEFS